MCINLFFSSLFFPLRLILFCALFRLILFTSIPIFCIFSHLIHFYFKINVKLFA